MNRNTKIALIVTGLLLAGGIAFASTRKPKALPSGNDDGKNDSEVFPEEESPRDTKDKYSPYDRRAFPLQKGNGGPDVEALQKFLNYSSSSYSLKVDGKFGDLTEGAVVMEIGKRVVDRDYFDTFIRGKF